MSGQLRALAALTPGKDPSAKYPLNRRLGGTQNLSGQRGEKKNLAHNGYSNSDPSAVQPVAGHYTYRAIPAPYNNNNNNNNNGPINWGSCHSKT
jgi:hypothetical protein